MKTRYYIKELAFNVYNISGIDVMLVISSEFDSRLMTFCIKCKNCCHYGEYYIDY